MGVDIPEAMEPMLAAFAKSGNLLDANGVAITDLDKSGAKFTLSMSDGFKALIKEVEHLTQVISDSLTKSIENVPPIEIPAYVRVEDNPVKGGKNTVRPRPADVPVESYQGGTDGYRDFGQGTPVMLHGLEAVVPFDESRKSGAFATVAGAGALAPPAMPPAVSVVINAQGAFFDTPGDLQRLADRVNDALTAKYGLQTMRRAG